MSSLNGRVAVVTGGAAGIGFGIARRLYAAGASVVVADLNSAAAVQSATDLGDRAFGVQHDVADEDSGVHLREQIIAQFGKIDILVNNAGVGPRPAPVAQLSVTEYDRVMNINARGMFLTTHTVSPALPDQVGRIINISSVMGQKGGASVSHYCASKFAILGMTKSWALEFASRGITVNAVLPGVIQTALHDAVTDLFATGTNTTTEESLEWFRSQMPLHRFQSAEDIGAMVTFLAGDDARNITGASMSVDGGWVMN